VIVLDSHIWFWWINLEFERFPKSWRPQIEQAGRSEYLPFPVMNWPWHKSGAVTTTFDPIDWFAEALQPAGIELLPVTPPIAVVRWRYRRFTVIRSIA